MEAQPRGRDALPRMPEGSHARAAFLRLVAVCVALLILPPPARAVGAPASRRRAVLVLLPWVTGEALLKELRQPAWWGLRDELGLGLMNCSTPSPGPLSGYVTLGAGRRIGVPGPPPETAAGEEADRAWAALLERVPEKQRALAGGLAAACRDAGKRVCLLELVPSGRATPDDRLAALGAVGPAGAVSMSPGWEDTADLFVVTPGMGADSLPSLLDGLRSGLDPVHDLVLVTSPHPVPTRNPRQLQLAPLLLWGGAWAGRWATSTTTRNPGLIANVDIAPTLLAHLGVPAPDTMEGHALRPQEHSGTLPGLEALAADSRSANQAMVPGLVGWGIIAFLGASWAIGCQVRGCGPRAAGGARLALLFLSAFPAAMLLSATVPALSPEALMLRIFGLAVAVAGLAFLLGRRSSPLLLMFGGLAVLIVVDLFLGGRMLARNLMSNFPNIGSRFYGIGNEYLGLLMGTTLLVPFWSASRRGSTRFSPGDWAVAALLWGFSLAAVGAPWMGADFGGAVSLVIAYVIAGSAAWKVSTGRSPRWGVIAAGLLLAGLVAVGLVLLDLMRPPGSRTHLGELAARVLGGGTGRVLEMIAGKVALNARMALSGYFLGGLAAVAPLLAVWYHKRGPEAAALLAARPLLKAGLSATFASGLVALVLNDTGVICWALVLGCCLIAALDNSLEARGAPHAQKEAGAITECG